MKNCKIFTEVTFENIRVIEKDFGKNSTIFTDDVIIHKKLKKQGLNSHHIIRYFGDLNPRINKIQDHAGKNTLEVLKQINDFQYKNASIVQAHRVDLIEGFEFLGKIKSIFEEQFENIVFLFVNPIRFYVFSIIDIARDKGYKISDDLISAERGKINFQEFQFYQIFLYNNKNCQDNQITIDEFTEGIEFSRIKNPKHAFFITTPETEFYSKPLYPIIDHMTKKNEECAIFTFDQRTEKIIKKKGYRITNVEKFTENNDFIHIILENLQKTIFEYISKMEKMKESKDIIISSFFKYFKNDRICVDTARILSRIELINIIFENFKFKSIMVGIDGDWGGNLVCNISKKYNIPSFSFPPAITSIERILHYQYCASKIFVGGEITKKEYVEMGMEPDRIRVVGNSIYDYIENVKKLKKDKKYITIVNSRFHNEDEKWIKELITFANDKELKVYLKLHPMYEGKESEALMVQEKIEEIKSQCCESDFEISYKGNLEEILSETKMLITEYSTVGVEASLMDIPIINANMNNELDYHKLPYNKHGIALYATNFSELCDAINKIITEQITNDRMTEARKKFNMSYNYKNDGKATERIFEILNNQTIN